MSIILWLEKRMLRVFLVKPYKFFCFYLGPSLKASHPTEVSLRVEADARLIKNDKTEREQTAAIAASNRTEKHRKVSMAPLNKTINKYKRISSKNM